MREVPVPATDPQRLAPHLAPGQAEALARATETARTALAGRAVWNVNSTASGGGVAEMLHQVVSYARGGGVDARWVTVGDGAEFFRVTKRLHHRLHGEPGDGGPLGEAERQVYERALAAEARAFADQAHPGDVVVLHDPQPLGLAAALTDAGLDVVWRCHIGTDHPNELSAQGWVFLAPYLERVAVQVYSRDAYIPPSADRSRCRVLAPAIDPCSPKNAPMPAETVRSVLAAIGVLTKDGPAKRAVFERDDGSRTHVRRRAHVVHRGPLPDPTDPLVVQVSRWDPLKDMTGVMAGFAEHVAGRAGAERARLALVGPDPAGVADDPEGRSVYDECVAAWHRLPEDVRRSVLLVSLPMDDPAENAAMVNALQRHAAVVVQKSLAEGFGLTVAEAMWKARPLVASRVGGIPDQVTDACGVLLDDPRDPAAFGAAVGGLLADPGRAAELGRAAQQRVREHFLADRQLLQWADVLGALSR